MTPLYMHLLYMTDLKSVLEEASLGHHYHIFREQEVDYRLFITMDNKDLADVGILDSSDRAQLLELITRLTAIEKGSSKESNSGGTVIAVQLVTKCIWNVDLNYSSIPSLTYNCLLYTSPSPRDATLSRMPSSA